MRSQINILIACECSQTITIAFRKAGFNAYSCDLQKSYGTQPQFHFISDCFEIIKNCAGITETGDFVKVSKWDLIIAHPPCTYISKAGAKHMYPKAGQIDKKRLKKGLQAKEFFMKFFDVECEHIAIENPTPLKVIELPEPTQVIQPYYFGEPYSKRTLLWLINLPLLEPTNVIDNYKPFVPSNTSKHSKGFGGSKGVAQSKNHRSKTFEGIASAIVKQWGNYLETELLKKELQND